MKFFVSMAEQMRAEIKRLKLQVESDQLSKAERLEQAKECAFQQQLVVLRKEVGCIFVLCPD